MDRKSVYQQAKALANIAAFQQFDQARVTEFLRFYNGSGVLGKYSNGERLLAVWLTGMVNGTQLPLTLAAVAIALDGLLSASDFVNAAAALNISAESLAMLVNEIARQARV